MNVLSLHNVMTNFENFYYTHGRYPSEPEAKQMMTRVFVGENVRYPSDAEYQNIESLVKQVIKRQENQDKEKQRKAYELARDGS